MPVKTGINEDFTDNIDNTEVTDSRSIMNDPSACEQVSDETL